MLESKDLILNQQFTHKMIVFDEFRHRISDYCSILYFEYVVTKKDLHPHKKC